MTQWYALITSPRGEMRADEELASAGIERRASPGEARRYFSDVVLPYEGADCLMWPYATVNGYGVVQHENRTQLVHRVVCEEAHGPPPTPKHEAAHSCGRGHEGCCTKRHLSWKTPSENHADKLTHGTHNRGERNNMVKLTEPEVRQIVALKGSILQRDIAAMFGVSISNVSQIQSGKRWGWLA